MYTTCLFCHGNLGRNDVIEAFPVGMHLAFDSAKGRLWVVCRSCRRWNLTPIESRWEAVEECERRYRGARLHATTEHIGLARLPGGVSLIRVGKPRRPELVAWRYGRMLGWRRIRTGVVVGAGLAGATTIGAGLTFASLAGAGEVVSILGPFGVYVGVGVGRVFLDGLSSTVVARVPAHGRVLRVTREDLSRIRLVADTADDHYRLVVHHKKGVEFMAGAPARFALGHVLKSINRFGAGQSMLDDATELIERDGGAEAFVRGMYRTSSLRVSESLSGLPEATRLAFEMSLHEETERRALDGELATLEQAWRDAEQVAAIADGILLPESVQRAWRALKSRG